MDAVDRADVHAGQVFDVDAGLGDDVGHRGGSVYRGQKSVDQFSSLPVERRFRDHLIEPGLVRAAQPRGVLVVREAEQRHVRILVGDVVRIDASNVRDHQIRRIRAVARHEVMARERSLELGPDEESTPANRIVATAARGSTLLPSEPMQFVTVAQVADVAPGTVSAVKAGEVEIALVNLDGEFFALQGHCLHLQGPLGEGVLDANHYLTCPWHGWKYDPKTGKTTSTSRSRRRPTT